MNRKKFLLATMGAPGGDLNPVIGLALELVQRGHGVTIASSGSHRKKIERLGLDYLCLRPSMDQNQLQTWMKYAIQSSIAGNRYMVRDLVLPHVEWNYHQLEKVVPDYDVLLCHTLAYPVPLIAKKLGEALGIVRNIAVGLSRRIRASPDYRQGLLAGFFVADAPPAFPGKGNRSAGRKDRRSLGLLR